MVEGRELWLKGNYLLTMVERRGTVEGEVWLTV